MAFSFLRAGLDLGVHRLVELGQFVGDGRIEHDHRFGAVVRGAHGPELETVAGEGEGRGTVAVGVVHQEGGDVRDAAHLEDVLGVEADRGVALAVLQLVQHGRYLRAEEGGDNGRGRLVGPQSGGRSSPT